MTTLHILKSEPDQFVRDLIKTACKDRKCKQVALFKKDTDWELVLNEIFAADKVICWW
ncbi:hypothetical protein [Desulfonatronovibrio hydrogenovorans]|uniref:hypothetical protein n=1 Tax=Desulfonatronovibrio hydrogenovorans TaxID=53245 RepID=UPI0012946B4A|nr:hypothetical protein [Desulfonatronovibrio hydrogenovorans]